MIYHIWCIKCSQVISRVKLLFYVDSYFYRFDPFTRVWKKSNVELFVNLNYYFNTLWFPFLTLTLPPSRPAGVTKTTPSTPPCPSPRSGAKTTSTADTTPTLIPSAKPSTFASIPRTWAPSCALTALSSTSSCSCATGGTTCGATKPLSVTTSTGWSALRTRCCRRRGVPRRPLYSPSKEQKMAPWLWVVMTSAWNNPNAMLVGYG